MGINECQSSIVCVNDLSNRHRLKTEEKYPELLADIEKLMELCSNSDKLITDYVALYGHDGTGSTLKTDGMQNRDLTSAQFPISWSAKAIDYVLLPRPRFKKDDETDAIFENVWLKNNQADADPESLRISIDPRQL